LNGNVVDRINKVNQRRAQLVLGWVTVSSRIDKSSWYVTNHPRQLSLAILSCAGAMSTSKSWDVKGHIILCNSPTYKLGCLAIKDEENKRLGLGKDFALGYSVFEL